MFRFSKIYVTLTILLFLTEVLIGAHMHDSIIRPYGGDFLVVMLIYCFVKSIMRAPPNITALCVLLFSYTVEISQYFKLVAYLGLKDSKWANILLGNSFSWVDMLMYTLGILLVIAIEKIITKSQRKRPLRITKTL